MATDPSSKDDPLTPHHAFLQVMPLIALYLPLDAIASVMDVVLPGSQQASWMSRTMVATSAACYAALLAAQVS